MTVQVDRVPAVVLSGHLGATRRTKGLNECALALTQSLGRRGVRVYRFHPDRSLIDLESRFCTHVACPNLYDDEAALADCLMEFAHCVQGNAVLFSASDGASEFIARNEKRLRDRFALTTPSWSCLSQIQNKQRLLERASQAGVPIPKTYFPTSPQETDRIGRMLAYPAVVKPLTSHHWKRAEVVKAIGPVKAVVVSSAEELADLYRKLAPLAPEVMIQEIIPGEDDRLLTFLGYIGRDGTARAGCVRKKLRQYPPGFGYCCLTETVKDPQIMDLSIGLLRTLGYRGIGCVEFKRDPRDERPKLIEINARAVRTTGAAIGAGVDLPWIAYQEMTFPHPPAPVFEYVVPVRWIHLPSETKAAFMLMWKGQLSPWRWLRIFRGRIVLAIWAWDDLRPSVLAMLAPLVRRLVVWPYYGLRRWWMRRFRLKGECLCTENETAPEASDVS